MKDRVDHLRPFFWDSDISKINIKEHKQYLMERILELGDEKAVQWLFSHLPLSEIKQTLKNNRRISEKSKNYWCLILEE